MKKTKLVLGCILLILNIVFFLVGITMIIQSKDRAVRVVTDTIETGDVSVDTEAVEQSIELYSKNYKIKGTIIVILSSLVIASEIYEKKKTT